MASLNSRSVGIIALSLFLVVAGLYLIDPTLFGFLSRVDSFEGTMGADSSSMQTPGQDEVPGSKQKKVVEENENSQGGDSEGFEEDDASGNMPSKKAKAKAKAEGFANMEDVAGPAAFQGSQGPAGCYPRDQLTPGELLPKDPNSVWAQQNPMGTGSLKGKNFLSAGALIGVNTVGQTLRNANYQLRSEPPNPQVPVTVFNNSTIEPDTNRRDLEIS
jgi:hypothetical protein